MTTVGPHVWSGCWGSLAVVALPVPAQSRTGKHAFLTALAGPVPTLPTTPPPARYVAATQSKPSIPDDDDDDFLGLAPPSMSRKVRHRHGLCGRLDAWTHHLLMHPRVGGCAPRAGGADPPAAVLPLMLHRAAPWVGQVGHRRLWQGRGVLPPAQVHARVPWHQRLRGRQRGRRLYVPQVPRPHEKGRVLCGQGRKGSRSAQPQLALGGRTFGGRDAWGLVAMAGVRAGAARGW